MLENMVARDGIEPPTPAFSELLSTNLRLDMNEMNLELLYCCECVAR